MKTRSVLLGDIADTCLGKMLDQNKNKGEYQPYLANVNVRWGGFDLDDLPQMKFLETEEERYGLRYGDILVCEGGEPGRCAIWKEQIPNMKFQKALHRVRVHQDEVDYRWLFYRFLYAKSRGEFDQYFSGTTTIKHMPGEKLVKIRLDLPELSAQNRIADVLSAYDTLIENNQKQIKLLEEAAQRLYKEWFVDLRFPGYENTPIVDGVPEGWEVSSIDSHITLCSGFAFKSSDFCSDGQYKIITIKNVKDGRFEPDNASTISEIPKQMPKHCVLSDGDILLSLTGNVGRVCLMFGEDCLLNQRVAKLQTPHPAYTYCLFRSKDMFDAMNNLANGAAQQNLSPVRTGKIEILFPCMDILDSFENIVAPMIQKIVSLNKQIQDLATTRDELLPKLMSGEMEV